MTRALIVEDKPPIAEVVIDVVESLGHEHDAVQSQSEARELLDGRRYSYALLDLEIPVRKQRGLPRLQNGLNLLREMVDHFGKRTPVIVMTGHGNDGPFQVIDCMKMGAVDYIPKPFPTRGRTLDQAILDALEQSGQSSSKAKGRSKPSGPPRAFEGGQMAVFKRRVEIGGVDVPISPQMHEILQLLTQRRASGKYVAYSAADLIEMLQTDSGQNGIAGQVLEFRNRVAQRLLEETNITIGRTDIINSGGPGYRLREWIVAENGARARSSAGTAADETTVESVPDAAGRKAGHTVDGFNERQEWALRQLKQDVPLQIGQVVSRFRCSSTTAKRDLSTLKTAGLIRFTGSARAGHYRLTSAGVKCFG